MASTKRKKFILFSLLVVCIIGIVYLLFNENGIIKYLKLKSRLDSLKVQVSKVEDDNKKLHESIDSLRAKVPAKIERVAREKYNMKRKGEKAIKIIEK